jgi:hypothetical protein
LKRAVAPGALLVLGGLAALHPGLRFVDMIPFSVRAEALLRGERLVDGLYPVGYPALLLVGRAVTGDVLVAGKVLSVLAGAGLVAGVARWLGWQAAVWLLAQTAVLLWGATEGTDLLAAALMIGAVALAPRTPWAGVLAGAACLVRYTGIAALPAVLLLSPRRGLTFAAFVAATAPHWAVALATGVSPLPSQDLNASIGAGYATRLWSTDTLARWPVGAWRAATAAFVDLPTWLGLVGLGFGLWRRDARAVGLATLALVHLLLIGLGFANPRLVLPATLAVALGAAWIPGRWSLLPAAAVSAALAWGPATASEPSASSADLAADATVDLEGPIVATSPWFHQRRAGWLVPAVQLATLVPEPGRLSPASLADLARVQGFRHVALEIVRTHRSAPGLDPLLRDPPPAGWRLVAQPTGWRVLAPP